MPTTKRTPYKAEWWCAIDGQQAYYTLAEVKAAEKRNRSRVLVDEHIGGGKNLLTVLRPTGATGEVRTCGECGATFDVVAFFAKATVCASCRNRRARNARKATA